MLPLGHFVVAAVPTVSYLLWQDRRFPGLWALFVIGVGSQFPDLVDKPLAHLFFILPYGRVGLHSLPIAIPVAIIALYVGWKVNRQRAGAMFVSAYGIHILADYYKVLLASDPQFPTDLFWPLGPPVARRLEPRWAGPDSINVKIWSLFSAFILVVGLIRLWVVYRSEGFD